jgi:hypothetical protein
MESRLQPVEIVDCTLSSQFTQVSRNSRAPPAEAGTPYQQDSSPRRGRARDFRSAEGGSPEPLPMHADLLAAPFSANLHQCPPALFAARNWTPFRNARASSIVVRAVMAGHSQFLKSVAWREITSPSGSCECSKCARSEAQGHAPFVINDCWRSKSRNQRWN